MDLSVERNGRKFVIDWKISSGWDSLVNQDFVIADCCFELEFALIDYGIVSLKLSKKPANNTNSSFPSLYNLEPRKIIVSKDKANAQLMRNPSGVSHYWGPVSWNFMKPAFRDPKEPHSHYLIRQVLLTIVFLFHC